MSQMRIDSEHLCHRTHDSNVARKKGVEPG